MKKHHEFIMLISGGVESLYLTGRSRSALTPQSYLLFTTPDKYSLQ